MRQRSISSIGVIIVGLVPAIIGGWVFAVAFTIITLLAFTELIVMMNLRRSSFRYPGYGVILIAAPLALFLDGNRGLPLLAVAALVLPLVLAVFIPGTDVIDVWSRTTVAALYLALPTFAAVSIRRVHGDSAQWLENLSGAFIRDGSAMGEGLGWFLLALLITWLSDTGAYLVGKRFGRRKLIPRVSPNKTVEGAVGGLISGVLTSLLCSRLFGLDLMPWVSISLGMVLAAVGMLGDLSESMIKRQLGVKDSGTLIPGHGGVLDRIDALIFVLVAAWVLIPVLK